MKIVALAAAFGSLIAWAIAAPGGKSHSKCITQEAADTLVARYAAVVAQQPSDLGSPALTARLITNPGYQEISDSADILTGRALGTVTVPSKQAFIESSQTNVPVVFNTIVVLVANCNYIIWQWVSPTFGSGLYEVKGFHLFEVSDGKLSHTSFEFNSVAGALDTGYTVTAPSGAPPIPPPS